MWDLLKKHSKECEKFRDELERMGAKATDGGSLEALLRAMPSEISSHATGCEDCHAAATEFLEVRVLFSSLAAQNRTAEEKPWFAGRVLAVIATKEAELDGPVGTWIELPKLASRLALASCAVLLVGSTWLYERPRGGPRNQPTAAAPEYLFEAPAAPMTQDDVLASLAENNR